MPQPKKISEFRPIISNVAQTSHYEVSFTGLPDDLMKYLNSKGVDRNFITREAGLLCASASLPGSSLATMDITGNRMGVMEKMAHTRIFTEIQLEFYVDKNYKMLKFMEHWIEFISSGSEENISDDAYYYRMRFPSKYKCNTVKIMKFDPDYKKEIEYNFVNMFPINLSSVAVQYGSSDTLKMSASFNFERYIPGKRSSSAEKRGEDNNKESNNQAPRVTTEVGDVIPSNSKLA